ncbi:hypothetical protein GCM10010912_38010 [Paenibacillus albidus]|uniref:VCBS repeat-containing protein n=1 Tax=Paenibacillus albidus TaxID=2041023 RepID=A0A917FM72_9BACL|nr:VCBS repeat-containing protein [Paenibacillus albidus]GGF89288.1 hypothetical protein GCM10010912_38010 [Paenibacillus albidus]
MKTSRLTTLLLLAVLATGCNVSETPSDLLRAPSQGNSDGNITEIVKPFLPANSHLTVPVNSASGSAIQLQDLDQDGQDEIIAFYKTDKTDYEIKTVVLTQKQNKWTLVETIAGVGSELADVQFADVTGDGKADLLLGFSGGEALSNELQVYSMNQEKLTEITKQPYDYLFVGDITGEGQTEIALFQNTFSSDTQPGASVQLLRLGNGQLQVLSNQSIDGTVIQVQFGKVSKTGTGLYVDVAVGAHSSYTALLAWEKGLFTDILSSEDYHRTELAESKDVVLTPLKPTQARVLGENNMAIKDYPLYSKDINADGINEVGFLIAPAGMESFAPLATPFISKYYQWDGQSKLIFIQEQFDRWGFNFHIPKNWAGLYTLETPVESPMPWENLQFSYRDAKTGKTAPLLSLRLLPKKDWAAAEVKLQAEQASYKMLYEIPNAEDPAASDIIVAVLPSASETGKLSGTALQEYQQRKLTMDEVMKLAGTPGKDTE